MLNLGFISIGIFDGKMGGGMNLAHNLGAVWVATLGENNFERMMERIISMHVSVYV